MIMYSINYTNRFIKDLKLCKKRGLDIQLIQDAVALLADTGTLPAQYHPHRLSGNRQGQWECHIQPNWLLIWEQNERELILIMVNTGTHSDLFDKKYKRR